MPTNLVFQRKCDKRGEIVWGDVINIRCFRLLGGASISGADVGVLEDQRLCDFPCEGMLPAASTDDQDTESHDKMVKIFRRVRIRLSVITGAGACPIVLGPRPAYLCAPCHPNATMDFEALAYFYAGPI